MYFITKIAQRKIVIWILFLGLVFSCSKQHHNSKKLDIVSFKKSLKKENSQESLQLIDSLLNSDEKLPNLKVGLLYLYKGEIIAKRQMHNRAIIQFEKAISFFDKNNELDYLAKTYWELGSSCLYSSEVDKGVENLLKALDYNKELGNKKLEANIYSSLSHAHYLYHDFDKAIKYTLKSIEIHNKEKDSVGLSSDYNNLAILSKNTGDYIAALDYNIKSLNLNLINKDSSAITKSYNNLGLVSERLGNFINAEKYFKQAVALNEKIKRLNSAPARNLGAYYLRVNKFNEAKKYYLKALEIEKKTEKDFILEDIYNVLLHIALQKNNIDQALQFQGERDILMLGNEKHNNEKKLAQIEIKYKLVAKEKALKQEKAINEKNKIIYAVVLGLLILFSIYMSQRAKHKQVLADKEKILLEQRVLRAQMNPHFIFNALSAIQNSLLDNEPIKSASYLSRFAKLIRQNFDFINEKKILLKDELDALQNYMDTQKMRFNDKFDYEINIFDTIDINVDEIPPLLLQPFIENSIEHGFKNMQKKGYITINIFKKDTSICYEIIDNGKGLTKDKREDSKLHAIDVFIKRLKLLGSDDEKHFTVNSSNKGTIIKFCLKQ